jgi:hypothetical protein
MRVKGRFFVLGWGAVFLAVASTVALRQYRAFTTVRAVTSLADSVQAISSVHGDLTGTLAGMQSPELLVPRAESLGLRQPTEGEQVPLSLPSR